MTDQFPEPTFPGPSPEPPAEPRLRRSRTDRVFAGVCGGLGHYFRIDPIILRIVMVALIFAGVGLIAYLIAWIAIPEAAEGEPEAPIPARNQRATAVVLGTSLLAVGVLLLMRATVPAQPNSASSGWATITITRRGRCCPLLVVPTIQTSLVRHTRLDTCEV